jgi:hypothetical protein
VERASLDSAHGGAGILIYRTLLIAFFVFGCSSQNTTLPYPLTISEEGLGAIHPNTPFDQVEGKLSGFTIDKLSQVSSDQSETIVQLKRGEKIFAQIISDPSGKKISQILILSPLIKNTHNQGIGDPLTPQNLLCTQESCHYSNEPSILYQTEGSNHTIREITYTKL